MEELILKGHRCVKGKASGEAMVCDESFCFVGGIDIRTGDVTEKDHAFYGQNIAGKVMVYPTGKGSTGGSYCLYAAAENNVGPAAIINTEIEQITAIGAIIADVPVVDHVEPDPLKTIKNGDFVEVDADNGTIRVVRK